jgi:hypothetical protein
MLLGVALLIWLVLVVCALCAAVSGVRAILGAALVRALRAGVDLEEPASVLPPIDSSAAPEASTERRTFVAP